VIRNSIAIQAIGTDGPGKIEFHWSETGGEPQDAFLPETGPGWLWPLSGERVGETLCLFFGQFVESDTDLGFESWGCLLVRVSNPDDPPASWKAQQFKVPFFEHSRDGDLIFGVGCLSHGGFVYVYGIREDWTQGVEGRSVLVARTPLEAFEEADFSEWRFFAGNGWTDEVSHCAPLFDGAATEMSISYLPGQGRFLAVYSYCGLSDEILARLAWQPEGPWGKPMVLYRCPEVSWNKDYFCYAGKAHPELARAGNEVVITYAVNSWDLEDHHRDLRLYWPRFVRVVGNR
jgi:hypothetical protein